MTVEARALVLRWYRQEMTSVLNRDHRGKPVRALAFGAVREDFARCIALHVADGRTPYALDVDAFRLTEAICQRNNKRIAARWRAEKENH